MVDLYSGVNSNELLRVAFQSRDQIAAFLSTCTVIASLETRPREGEKRRWGLLLLALKKNYQESW